MDIFGALFPLFIPAPHGLSDATRHWADSLCNIYVLISDTSDASRGSLIHHPLPSVHHQGWHRTLPIFPPFELGWTKESY